MSVETRIELSPEAERIVKRLENFPRRMSRAIARTLDKENELTVGKVQSAYLTGPRPSRLGVRTGRLRRSIRRVSTRIRGNTVASAIGTNVQYAGIHEFGFQGPVSVAEHSRRITQAFGMVLASMVTARVRAHTRRVDMQARPFLRPAIEDRIPDYERSLSEAIVTAATEDDS